MKISRMANIGLIFGILLILGFSIVPVSAADDTAWFTPAPLEDVMAWFKSQSQNVWIVPGMPADSSLTIPETTPSYTPSDDTAWYIPAPADQTIAWGQRISAQTTFPSTLSQADRIRLFKRYNTNGYAPTFPVVTVTSVPATLPAYPSNYQAITMPATPYYLPSTMPTAFPTQVPVIRTAYALLHTLKSIPNPFAHRRCGTWPEYRDIPVRTEPSGEVREDHKFGNNSGGHDRVEDNEQPGKCPYLYRLPPWRWNNVHLRAQPVFNPDRLLRKGRDGFAR